MHVFAIFMSSSVKCLFVSFAQFSIGLFAFFTTEFRQLFIDSRYSFFVEYVTCKYFLSVHSLSLRPLNWAFHRAKLCSQGPVYQFFSFMVHVFGVKSQSLHPHKLQRLFPTLFSINFIVLHFTLTP